jgi:hypothetical protein
MFEIDKSYRITVGSGDYVSSSTCKVIRWESPLLEVETGGIRKILNVNSSEFASAELEGQPNPLMKHLDFTEDEEDDGPLVFRDDGRSPSTGY